MASLISEIDSQNEIFQKIITSLEMKMPISIIGMPGMSKALYYRGLREKLPKVHPEFEVETFHLDEAEKLILEKINLNLPLIALIYIVNKNTSKEKASLFFDKIQKIRSEQWENFLPVIISNFGNASTSIKSNLEVITKRIFILSPLNQSETEKFLRESSKKYEISLNTNDIDQIFKLSGGNLGLIKDILFFIKTNQINAISLDSLLSDNSIKSRLDEIILDLPEKYIYSLNKLDLNDQNFDLLKKFGYINDRNKIFSELLEKYLESNIEIIQGKSISNSKLENYLTVQEKSLYTKIKDFEEITLSRDDIAKIIWGESWLDNYSDWAISQAIYRFKGKLKFFPETYSVKSNRKIGYIFKKEAK